MECVVKRVVLELVVADTIIFVSYLQPTSNHCPDTPPVYLHACINSIHSRRSLIVGELRKGNEMLRLSGT